MTETERLILHNQQMIMEALEVIANDMYKQACRPVRFAICCDALSKTCSETKEYIEKNER